MIIPSSKDLSLMNQEKSLKNISMNILKDILPNVERKALTKKTFDYDKNVFKKNRKKKNKEANRSKKRNRK